MVSHKRLEFGDNGYRLPANARARRSARKKRIFEKNCGDDRMRAFDLLATVAGTLLLESGNFQSASETPIIGSKEKCLALQNTVKNEFPDEEKPVKVESFCGDKHFTGAPSSCDDVHCGPSSAITNPDDSLMIENLENAVEGLGNSDRSDSCEVGSFDQGFKPDVNGDPVVLEVKPDVVVSLGGSSSIPELPVCGKDVFHGSRDDVNLVSRDDDENFSGYSHRSTTKRSCRHVPRIGDRRIRKILASRYWKGGTKNADVKPWYSAKRNYYLHHQRNYPIKKRRYFDYISELNSDDYNLARKMGSRTISSLKCQNGSYVSRDSHVRMRIKSFRVPELFIEIPETATVGSLKRTVMEAVTSVLGGGGIRVGLMLQGKKVRDDSKTLLQTGISQDNTHLDSLGFCLEPSSEASPLPCHTPLPLTRYPPVDTISHLHGCDDHVGNMLDSVLDSVACSSDSYGEKSGKDDSRALVPMEEAPAMAPRSVTALAPRPPSRKSKRAEQQQAAHRRIRRPFSVAEVEALVQAVEKLGTGRWRDIKLRAFENADHRTYVDLKDKWKTLVHTARITPQQRRGEPMPQELLDRVLNAHSYWAQQQQQLKAATAAM
ncbi:PREDICTED: telomere repeat-binding protein 2 isoform X2 [Tarenaya hassleriana]|uniref:telomere repeat-binding protein 2 isoform X2 n=1 Tax=Tarenaya hassleriana TaxID=28532 RepID=UPI00053C2151|nr:PREDICTED: telomere repeat-binding protein 2 isoform X2 [Tarenaya hassleriana]